MLDIKNLHITIDNKQIIKGLSLTIKPGEVHVLMGPNGAGKSTLGYALAGHPHYQISQTNNTSSVTINNQNLLSMSPDERAKAGLFLAFQYPVAVEGVTVKSFLRQAYRAIYPQDRIPLFKFRKMLEIYADELGIDHDFFDRYLNQGFSGGEKKGIEILQMRVLKPKFAVCDETDSGLDIDALKTVAQGIQRSVEDNNMGAIIITHYQRILQYLRVDKVHVMVDGKIIKSGGKSLVQQLEKEGYKNFK